MVENGANHPCSSLLDEFATEVERMTRLLTEAISKAGKGEIETAFTTLHQSLKEQQEATLKSESGADLLSATEKDALQDAMRMTIADYCTCPFRSTPSGILSSKYHIESDSHIAGEIRKGPIIPF